MRTEEIEYKGNPFRIIGIYTEGEQKDYHYGDGSGYSGSASEFDIQEVFVADSNIDIIDIFSHNDLTKMSELIIEKIEE